MGFLHDITGNKYTMLTVIKLNGKDKNRNLLWQCICDCGNEKVVLGDNLKKGLTQSCGCLNSKMSSERKTTHGKTRSKEYRSWAAMKERCYNPNYIQYKDYGGRGITVCDRWINSFENFIDDMGPVPEGDFSLDRINGELGYGPGNCRWADRTTQNRNKSCVKLSEEKAAEIRNSSESTTILSEKYYVSKTTIKDVKHNKTWK